MIAAEAGHLDFVKAAILLEYNAILVMIIH